MPLNVEAEKLLRATRKTLAQAEADLKIARLEIVRRDADDAIGRSGASCAALLADAMAAAGRISENGRDAEYHRGGRWLDRNAYVAELKRDPETARFFAGAVPKAAPLSTTANPFSRKTFNLTTQMRLIREDPDRAAELRREAD